MLEDPAKVYRNGDIINACSFKLLRFRVMVMQQLMTDIQPLHHSLPLVG